MGFCHRPVGGLFVLPRVLDEACVRLTFKRRVFFFFFGRNVGAHCSLAAEKWGLLGAARRSLGLGTAGSCPSSLRGGGRVGFL